VRLRKDSAQLQFAHRDFSRLVFQLCFEAVILSFELLVRATL